MSKPTIFSYLNSNHSILNPVMGSAGDVTTNNPGYNIESPFPGIMSTYRNREVNSYSDYMSFNIDFQDSGTIELWLKPDGWSFSGTTYTPTGEGSVETYSLLFFYPETWSGSYAGLIDLYYVNGQGLYADIGYNNNFVSLVITTSANAMQDGVWTHFAYVWEKGAVNTLEIYKDNILIGSTSNAIGTMGETKQVCIGGRNSTGTWKTRAGAQGWLSSFRYYNYPKRDFFNRYQLRSDMNDQKIFI
jgi:hypothetical protein